MNKNGFNSLKRSRGFTLVELMFVIAVLGVLIALAFPKFQQMSASSTRDMAPVELTKTIPELVYYARSANGAGCNGLTTAMLTAQNNGVAVANKYGNAVTVTNAAPTAVTIQYPVDNAANAAAIVGKIDSSFQATVNNANISIVYPCL